MRTTSALVAALVAAASVAGQQAPAPKRIYFPRHVKRQYSNATITSSESPVPSSEDASSTPTKRQSNISDLIDSLTDLPFPSVAAAVTTVVIQSTVFVPPSPTLGKSNGTIPEPSLTSDAPLSTQPSAQPSEGPANPISKPPTSEPDPASDSAPVSLAPTTTSSSTGIVIAPTGVVSESTTPTPTTTAEPTTKDPLKPIESIVSEVVSVITSVLPPVQNATTIPDEPLTLTSTPVTIPDTTPPGTGIVTSTTEPPPPQSTTDGDKPTDPTPPVSSPTLEPPPPSNTTEPPPPPSSTPTPPPGSETSGTVTPPPSSFTISPSPPPITNSTSNTTFPDPTPTPTDDPSGVTSIPQLGSTTNSESWLPTTILVDPTSTTVSGGLAPTTATGIPSAYPKAITPADAGNQPQPPDTTLIQIGLLEGYNYPFVVANTKAAAQIFQVLPDALGYAVGEDLSKIQMRKLIPLDTGASMGFITTLAIVSFPNNLVESLRVYVKAPNSPLYNNPDALTYNFTKQINPAIDITIGSYVDEVAGGGSSGLPGGGGSGSGNDPFNNPETEAKTPAQSGTTAAIIGSSVFVAAAYGAVMFVIARRYKKKKQAHRRASSISNNSSEMRQTPSPALMGGALLSRDFTGYGGVTNGSGGAVAGGRDSHGSGRSGMNNSARTQYISAPVAAENSLGWN
jgi:hypothetical protein